MDHDLNHNYIWITLVIIIMLPIIASIVLLIGSREGWFGRGELSKKIDRILFKLWQPVALLYGGAAGSSELITAALDKSEPSYTCKYCKHQSHQNLEFCPKCERDDDGNRSDACPHCSKRSNSNYNFCPHCGNQKPQGKA